MAATSEAEATSGTSEAGSGIGSRRTVSDAERDQTTTRLDQITDTGSDEGHKAGVLNQTRSWNANDKLAFDETLQALSRAEKDTASHLAGINTIREQLLSNMVDNADLSHKGYMRHLALLDRSVFTAENELEASVAAKTGVQQDALAVLIAKAVADGIAAVSK